VTRGGRRGADDGDVGFEEGPAVEFYLIGWAEIVGLLGGLWRTWRGIIVQDSGRREYGYRCRYSGRVIFYSRTFIEPFSMDLSFYFKNGQVINFRECRLHT
jgi:hypothetical protein